MKNKEFETFWEWLKNYFIECINDLKGVGKALVRLFGNAKSTGRLREAIEFGSGLLMLFLSDGIMRAITARESL